MSKPPSPGVRFVEQMVFNYLDALRTSKEMEQRYVNLSQRAKRATTDELKQLASHSAAYILEHVKDMKELARLSDNVLLREAITRAIADHDDQSHQG